MIASFKRDAISVVNEPSEGPPNQGGRDRWLQRWRWLSISSLVAVGSLMVCWGPFLIEAHWQVSLKGDHNGLGPTDDDGRTTSSYHLNSELADHFTNPIEDDKEDEDDNVIISASSRIKSPWPPDERSPSEPKFLRPNRRAQTSRQDRRHSTGHFGKSDKIANTRKVATSRGTMIRKGMKALEKSRSNPSQARSPIIRRKTIIKNKKSGFGWRNSNENINNDNNNNNGSIGANDSSKRPKLRYKNVTEANHPMCGQNRYVSERIVNGKDAKLGQFPWVSALVSESGFLFCGGSILNEWFIITAAHCLDSNIPIEIRVGAHKRYENSKWEQRRQLIKVIKHERYNSDSLLNDIALGKLDRPLTFDQYVRPICLPTRREVKALKLGTNLTVIGWGTVQVYENDQRVLADSLQMTRVPLMDEQSCMRGSNTYNSTTQFCAGLVDLQGRSITDSCSGDSGGPIMQLNTQKNRWIQYGLVSYGDDYCQANYGFYTKLGAFLSWIITKMSMEWPP